jgi:hypothetical protein
MTRGYFLRDLSDWRDVYEYRFVEPESRGGANRNYLQRLKGATAYVLAPSGDVIYHSRALREQSKGIDFVFVFRDSTNEARARSVRGPE